MVLKLFFFCELICFEFLLIQNWSNDLKLITIFLLIGRLDKPHQGILDMCRYQGKSLSLKCVTVFELMEFIKFPP